MEVVAGTPEAMTKFLTTEIARWGKVVKDNAIRAD
jgi:tripartite-type tricarboxylate transporter receptor subunit TctC